MVPESASLRALAALAASAVLLSGCPAPAPRPPSAGNPLEIPQPSGAGPSVPPPAAPAPRPPPPPPRENRLSPATRSLVTQARGLMSHGDLDAAAATLDRALRIQPNNPLVWIEVGRLRLAENDAHQAESCGRKALALASGDHDAQAQAGRLLADALRSQGRNPEAGEIEHQPFMR